jgi:3',5'-nucleoside bisphosphate phosphatase
MIKRIFRITDIKRFCSAIIAVSLIFTGAEWAYPYSHAPVSDALQVPSAFNPADISFLSRFTAEYFGRKVDVRKYRYPLVVPLPNDQGIVIYNFAGRKGNGPVPCLVRDAAFNPITEFDVSFGRSGDVAVSNIRAYSAESLNIHYHGKLAESSREKELSLLRQFEIVRNWQAGPERRIEAVRVIKNMWEDSGKPVFDDMLGRLDLHNHTIHSDGQMTPSYLVVANWLRGMSGMAITDHNTMDAIPEAMEAADILGVNFLPGVEISVFDREMPAEKFHCALYWAGDPDDYLKWTRSERGSRWITRIRGINESARKKMDEVRLEYNRRYTGLEISARDVSAMFPKGAVKRTDLARVIFKKYGRVGLGVNDIHETKEKFIKNIRVDMPEREDTLEMEDVKELLSGGAFRLVFLHPLVRAKWDIRQVEEVLRKHAPFFDGVEVWHPSASDDQITKLTVMCEKLNTLTYRDKPLILTIGSDTHSMFDKKFGFNTSSATPDGLRAIEGSFRASRSLPTEAREKYMAEFLTHWAVSPKNRRDLIDIKPVCAEINSGVMDWIEKLAVSEKRRRGAVFLLRTLLKRGMVPASMEERARELGSALKGRIFEELLSRDRYFEKTVRSMTDIFSGKEPTQKTVVIRHKTYYNDEPKLQNYFMEISLVNTDLLKLWARRRAFKSGGAFEGLSSEDIDKEIDKNAESLDILAKSVEDPTHPYTRLLSFSRGELRAGLKRAAELIRGNNEPAACAKIISCASHVSNEMEMLIRKRMSHYPSHPKKRFSSRGGVIDMRRGRRVSIPVSSSSTVNFRVYGNEKYELISEAISSKRKELESQISELRTLKDHVSKLSAIRSKIREVSFTSVSPEDAAELKGAVSLLRRAQVPAKVIAYKALRTSEELLSMADPNPDLIDTAIGIGTRFIILRMNELSDMIESTRSGKLQDLKDLEDAVSEDMEYIISSLKPLLADGNRNEAARLLHRLGHDPVWKDLRRLINDPHWRHMNKYIGKMSFLISEGRLNEAEEVLNRAKIRVKGAKILIGAIRRVYDEYFDANLFGEKVTLEEVFERIFLEYVAKSGLNKASPSERVRKAALWRIELYRDIFVPYRVGASGKDGEKTKRLNTFYAGFSYFLKIAHSDVSRPLKDVLDETLGKFMSSTSSHKKGALTGEGARELERVALGFDLNGILGLSSGVYGGEEDKTSDEFWPYLNKITDEKKVADDLVAAIVSACLTKKVVLAFDLGIGGPQGARALKVIEALDRLRKDKRYRSLLENNLITVSAVPENLPAKLDEFIKDGALVFTFARIGEREKFSSIEPVVESSYVDIPEEFPHGAYIPLPEIVAMAIGRYLRICDPSNVPEDIKREINIGTVASEDRTLIFRLLPKAGRIYNEKEALERYRLLMQFLAAV